MRRPSQPVVKASIPPFTLERAHSVPGIGSVLAVVFLELNLIFDLIDEDLGEKNSHQLWDSKAQGHPSQQEEVAMDPVDQLVDAPIGVDIFLCC